MVFHIVTSLTCTEYFIQLKVTLRSNQLLLKTFELTLEKLSFIRQPRDPQMRNS
jgi:hypothetical protein